MRLPPVFIVILSCMPVRYLPPQGKSPASRRLKNTDRTGRIVHYEQPRVSFWRLVGRRLFSAPVLVPLAFLSALVFGVLIYYWTTFSGRIDNLLEGEVFTRSAGIYAAPKQLRVGEVLSQDDLVAYLKRAGYVEKGQQADTARGRYSRVDLALDVEPSQDSTVDGQRQFQPLHVQFSRTGKAITAIGKVDGSARFGTALL